MNFKTSLLAAALLTGVFSTSAFATTTDAHAKTVSAVKIEAPVLTKMVSPTGMTRHHGETVTLSFTVDVDGQPRDIQIVSMGDRALTKSLVPAVSQWQFTPARKNGLAVPAKVVLPIQLVEASS